MIRIGLIVALVVHGVSCKKADQDAPAPVLPGSGSAGGAAAPAPAPASKWLVLDGFGIEVEAPGCAELTPIDSDSVGVGPADAPCPIPFPGVVFTRTLFNINPTLDEQLAYIRSDQPPPEITRQENTATGWVIEWKKPGASGDPARTGINQYYKLDAAPFACIAWGAYTDVEHELLVSICNSARRKQ